MDAALVIMAAGLGSRYGGVKQMEGVGPLGEILMEYSIYDALRAGFRKIVIIIKPNMLEDVKERFGNHIEKAAGIKIDYAFQVTEGDWDGTAIPAGRTKPLGTVHALLSARQYLDCPFAAINADDFYGREAFEIAYQELQKLHDSHDSMMVAYRLKNTVSPFGTVTRGVCKTEGGELRKVVETYKIKLFPDGVIRDTAETETGPVLDPECPVSMNFWGYHPGMVQKMNNYFLRFLNGLAADDNKSECLLPVMMDAFIHADVRCVVKDCGEQWFGLTYQEDRPGVMEALKKLHDKGIYPAFLWN